MYPYYVMITELFDTDTKEYNNGVQPTISGTIDSTPTTSFKKHNAQIISGYLKYDLTCETLNKQKGRAYGYPEAFDQWIAITERNFYYNDSSNIVILNSPKETFIKFHKDFSEDSSFRFKKIDVDFESIIQNQLSSGIEGIWLGKVPDINISSLLLLGNRVEDSANYQHFLNQGSEITNITIIYNYNGSQEKVMITKDGGIILYHYKDETDSLLLVEDIYRNLINV